MKLVFEAIAGAARAAPDGIAALNHEVRNDSVKDGPVVERDAGSDLASPWVDPFLGARSEANEVLHGLGRSLFLEAEHNGPERGVDPCIKLPGASGANF